MARSLVPDYINYATLTRIVRIRFKSPDFSSLTGINKSLKVMVQRIIKVTRTR
jgi:hypothetical protein